MKHKLATIPAVVAAPTVCVLSFQVADSPAGAVPVTTPPPGSWRIEDH